MSLVKDIIARKKRLQSERSNFDNRWQRIAELVHPTRANFTTKRAKGQELRENIFDGTPEKSLDIFASSTIGIVANPATKWFKYGLQDPSLLEDNANREWLDLASQTILNAFNDPEAKFYRNLKATLQELGAFGNGAIFLTKGKNSRLMFSARPLNELMVALDADGGVDTIFRCFEMTARQLKQKARDEEWSLSPKINDLKDKDMDKPIKVIHAMFPKEELKGDLDMPFASVWVDEQNEHLMFEGGFFELPIAFARWDIICGESYGRGIGDIVLPDVRTLNQSSKGHMIAMEKTLNPPLQGPSEVYGVVDLTAGAYNVLESMNSGGRGIEPIQTVGNLPITMEWERERRLMVQNAFFVDQLSLASNTAMTATEVLQRQDEKARLLAPSIGSVQAELIGPMLIRALGITMREGLLPPPPPDLQGQELEITYQSSLARAQQFTDAQSILDYLQSIAIVGQLNPEALDNVDWDETLRELHRVQDVPAKTLNTLEEVIKIRADRQAAMQQQQQLEQLHAGSEVAKNASDAGIL